MRLLLVCFVMCAAVQPVSEREIKDGTAYVAIYECMATYKIIKKKEKRKGGCFIQRCIEESICVWIIGRSDHLYVLMTNEESTHSFKQ